MDGHLSERECIIYLPAARFRGRGLFGGGGKKPIFRAKIRRTYGRTSVLNARYDRRFCSAKSYTKFSGVRSLFATGND